MKMAAYLTEVKTAGPMRARAMDLARKTAQELGCVFYTSAHFIERFGQRAAHPIRAVGDFELSIRMIKANWSSRGLAGKQVALKVNQHVFIYDCKQLGQIRAVSFWLTDKPGVTALAGRGDIILEC